jgi:hypothetical protein
MTKSFQRLLGLLILTLGFPLGASAAVIIDSTTAGLYNSGLGDLAATDGPGGFFLGANVSEGDPVLTLNTDPGLTFGAAFGANWLAGDYTGGTWSAGPVAIPSAWAVNSETAIVYDFILDSASDLHIDLGVDNGILVWLNGNFLFGASAAGGASINEYDFDVLGLAAGNYSLQLIRADHGGSTGYQISVDATAAPVSVPEPATLSLLGLALLMLGAARNRKV